MEVKEAIENRRSYRSYSIKEVEENKLEEILHAGMCAPVATGAYSNTKFLVLEGEKLKTLQSLLIKNIKKDPTYGCNKLVMIYSKQHVNDLAALDAGCIGENMMLRATDLGISSVIVYCIKMFFNQFDDLKSYLSLDDEYKFVVSICLGYRDNDEFRQHERKIDIIR